MPVNTIPIISTKRRVVWTRDEKRLIDRVSKLFHDRGARLLMECGSALCQAPRFALVADDAEPAGRVLACGCTKHVFLRRT